MSTDKIPTSKIERAMKFATTGAKVGGNYIKHYAKKAIGSDTTQEELDKANADIVFETLGELKGSALKAAQMLSMDKHVLPKAYIEKFALAQYSAPALSLPLVVKTFQQYFKKSPLDIFDTFSKEAVHAASMGQVHKATLNGKTLAVKIQYPGVADSIESDLNMLKPIAMKIMEVNAEEMAAHFDEVKARLIEETDYVLELNRSLELSEKCKDIKGLVFPKYYKELCSERILTMDWMDAIPIKEFIAANPSQAMRNKVGQVIWNFYQFQVGVLNMFHADPHPGNFLIYPDGTVGIIDFGCVKVLSKEFYASYSRLIIKDIVFDDKQLQQVFEELKLILPNDSDALKQYIFQFGAKTIRHITQPFFADIFDFSDENFIKDIITKDDIFELKKQFMKNRQARGPKDAIYLNRTYFGLYNILHELKAVIDTREYRNN